jgi:hypothetical protein
MPGDQNLKLEAELGRRLSSSASLYEPSPTSERRAEPTHPSTLHINSSDVADPSYTPSKNVVTHMLLSSSFCVLQ